MTTDKQTTTGTRIMAIKTFPKQNIPSVQEMANDEGFMAWATAMGFDLSNFEQQAIALHKYWGGNLKW